MNGPSQRGSIYDLKTLIDSGEDEWLYSPVKRTAKDEKRLQPLDWLKDESTEDVTRHNEGRKSFFHPISAIATPIPQSPSFNLSELSNSLNFADDYSSTDQFKMDNNSSTSEEEDIFLKKKTIVEDDADELIRPQETIIPPSIVRPALGAATGAPNSGTNWDQNQSLSHSSPARMLQRYMRDSKMTNGAHSIGISPEISLIRRSHERISNDADSFPRSNSTRMPSMKSKSSQSPSPMPSNHDINRELLNSAVELKFQDNRRNSASSSTSSLSVYSETNTADSSLSASGSSKLPLPSKSKLLPTSTKPNAVITPAHLSSISPSKSFTGFSSMGQSTLSSPVMSRSHLSQSSSSLPASTISRPRIPSKPGSQMQTPTRIPSIRHRPQSAKDKSGSSSQDR